MLGLTEPMTIGMADSSAESGIERRRGFRIQQSRPIKIFEHSGSRYFGGQTTDVSSTGLRLELPASMPVRAGKLVSVHVGLSETGNPLANRRQMIPARVVWVTQPSSMNAKTIYAGVEFLASISAQLDAA
jgi:PilZ domain-containing protein